MSHNISSDFRDDYQGINSQDMLIGPTSFPLSTHDHQGMLNYSMPEPQILLSRDDLALIEQSVEDEFQNTPNLSTFSTPSLSPGVNPTSVRLVIYSPEVCPAPGSDFSRIFPAPSQEPAPGSIPATATAVAPAHYPGHTHGMISNSAFRPSGHAHGPFMVQASSSPYFPVAAPVNPYGVHSANHNNIQQMLGYSNTANRAQPSSWTTHQGPPALYNFRGQQTAQQQPMAQHQIPTPGQQATNYQRMVMAPYQPSALGHQVAQYQPVVGRQPMAQFQPSDGHMAGSNLSQFEVFNEGSPRLGPGYNLFSTQNGPNFQTTTPPHSAEVSQCLPPPNARPVLPPPSPPITPTVNNRPAEPRAAKRQKVAPKNTGKAPRSSKRNGTKPAFETTGTYFAGATTGFEMHTPASMHQPHHQQYRPHIQKGRNTFRNKDVLAKEKEIEEREKEKERAKKEKTG